MISAALIDAMALPPDSRLDQRVPKKLLLEQGAPTAADKRYLQDGIDEMTWVAALKPTNIGVPSMPLRRTVVVPSICINRPYASKSSLSVRSRMVVARGCTKVDTMVAAICVLKSAMHCASVRGSATAPAIWFTATTWISIKVRVSGP